MFNKEELLKLEIEDEIHKVLLKIKKDMLDPKASITWFFDNV